MPAITFFLVRHGEAETNVSNTVSSYPETRDFHLTEKGKLQIRRVAEVLKKRQPDLLFSSPLLRARESAEIISEAIRLPVIEDVRLRETDFGTFNGHSALRFFGKYPHPRLRVGNNQADGVEGYLGIRDRADSFLRDMAEQHPGKKIVIVSHGDTLEQLRGAIAGRTPGKAAIGWVPRKGSCTEVAWNIG